jgi:tetratricopeptide (TPR) repeat protein
MRVSAPGPGPGDDRGRLTAAVAAQPRNPHLRRALAVSLARAGEACAALDQYRALLELVPNEPDAAADAGLMARRCALEEEVLPLVRSAAAANPNHARLRQVLGLMHRALDELEPARAALDRAAALDPGDPRIAHGQARAWLDSGGAAAAKFERARQLAPEDPAVAVGLFEALVAERREEEAVPLACAELRRHPDWVPVHRMLALHLWAGGRGAEFTAALEAALKARPADILLWRELIMLLMQAQRYDAALAAIVRGRAAAGDHLLFDANEAFCHSDLGHYSEADRLFARLPSERGVMLRFVGHLLRTGRPEQAERIAAPFARRDGGADFWPYLSLVWRLTGNPAWQWLEADPRLVGVYDLEGALPLLEELAECLRALHRDVAQPLDQSVRGGTQTPGILFSRVEPEIRALRSAVVDAVRGHAAQLPPPDPTHPLLGRARAPIRFAGSWSVRLAGGGRHANHVHPAGWLSSALYVALPDPSARGPEPAGWLALGEPPAELKLDLPAFRLVEPRPGRLVLFPSTMWHGTKPFAEGERLTVAFDVAIPA